MVSSYMISMFKITHSNLCVAHDTDSSSITTFQPIVLQVPDSELVSTLAVSIGDLATMQDITTVDTAAETQTGVDSIYGGTVSVTTITETGHETHNMSTVTQTIPSPMSFEVEAAPKETSLQGQLRNVPKQKIIGECVCGGPVTADEMNDEDESICCKQKGCETSWVSKSDYINQQLGTYKLYSIILHVQVLNGSRVDVWLMQA